MRLQIYIYSEYQVIFSCFFKINCVSTALNETGAVCRYFKVAWILWIVSTLRSRNPGVFGEVKPMMNWKSFGKSIGFCQF